MVINETVVQEKLQGKQIVSRVDGKYNTCYVVGKSAENLYTLYRFEALVNTHCIVELENVGADTMISHLLNVSQ